MIFKERICKYCKAKYQPDKPKQIVCSAECAIAYSEKQRTKQLHTQARMERKALREKKQALKTRSDWIKETQIVFNRFIRLRDQHLPCICCGLPLRNNGDNLTGGSYDCGHFRSVGSAPHLRFDERNAHGQRKQCNRWGSGRAVDYRIGLCKRIGVAEVEAIEADNTPRHYTIDDLKALKSHYQAKIKEMEKAG